MLARDYPNLDEQSTVGGNEEAHTAIENETRAEDRLRRILQENSENLQRIAEQFYDLDKTGAQSFGEGS